MPSVPGQSAPIAFTARAFATASSSLPTFVFVSGSVSTQLDLSLQMPAPVGGRLLLTGSYSSFGGAGSGSIGVDVGGDGTVEFVADYLMPYAVVDVPLPVGVTTIRLACVASHGQFVQDNGGTTVTVQGQFFPNEPAIHSFDATGAGTTLRVDHPAGDTVTLSIGGLFQPPVLLAFGFQPVVVPLAPYVTQLVTLDTVFAIGSITLTLPALPSGTALYCQGLVLQPSNVLISSNSVRAIWP
jgi:hypothetical protein